MKDYRLSEIFAYCKEMHDKYYGMQACMYCVLDNPDLSEVCEKLEKCPLQWNDIEPRDMIELPYKQFHEVYASSGLWFIFYRNKDGLMESRYFNEETEADEFLAKLKGSKK